MRPPAILLARALLTAALGTGLTVGSALAVSHPPRLGLTPVGQTGPYFELTMEPGETRRLEVELSNSGGQPVLARTYAADAYSIVNGGFGVELSDEGTGAVTRWMDYHTREVELGPQDAVVLEFEVTVPDRTAPGEYITSLVVENAEPFAAAAEGSLGIEQVNRSAIAVAIDVPGVQRSDVTIGGVSHHVAGESSVIAFQVTNGGNVHLKPIGRFVLRNFAGDEVAEAAAEMGSVYAGTDTILELPLTGSLSPGDYCAELSLRDEEVGAEGATACLPFSVLAPSEEDSAGTGSQTIPIVEPVVRAAQRHPAVLAALLVAAVVTGTGVVAFRRRRRTGTDRPSDPAGGVRDWPAAEELPIAGTAVPLPDDLRPLVALREALAALPGVECAWLIERSDRTDIAIQGAAEMTLAAGADLAGAVQALADDLSVPSSIRIRYVQGVGPVIRATGMARLFYRRPKSQAPSRA